MKLPDHVLGHLRQVTGNPDLSGTIYRLIRKLGSGGMGAVFAVFDERLQREVALKVLALEGEDEQRRQRLLREAQIIAGLEHPGIIPIHDVGELANNSLYYTMKRVHGQTLTQYLDQSRELSNLLSIFRKVCDAVAFAHSRNIIHRDLKPDNIMIGDYGEVLVLDWGIARAEPRKTPLKEGEDAQSSRSMLPEADNITQAGTVMGTPAYMSPEQAAGQVEKIEQHSDVFALGKILIDILEHLQHAKSDEKTAPARYRRLFAIGGHASNQNPEDRYSSIKMLIQEIDRFEAEQAIEAYRETVVESFARWANKHRFMILLIVGYLVVRYLLFFFSRY